MRGVRRQRRGRRTVLRVILVTQLVVAVVTALVISVAYRNLDRGFTTGEEIDHQNQKDRSVGGEPLNILVMGSDTRAGAGNSIDGESSDSQRSDTTILVHVSSDRKTVYGVSLPRDAMVARPACQAPDGDELPAEDLVIFNDAFSAAGATCTVAQVESLTGLYIDHYVTLDFNGFKEMVDAVHGVTVCIPEDIDDSEHGITFEAGTQELTGQKALDYVRERSSTPNADIGRMKRQQAFLASMINKVVSAGTLTRPSRVYNFLQAATTSITTDPDLSSLSDLVHLAWEFRRTDLDNISFVTVPFEEYPEDPNRLIWSASAVGLWRAIETDQPLPRRYRDDAINADAPPGTPAATPPASPSSPAGPSTPASPSTPATPTPSGDGEQEADANGLCV